MGKMKMMMMMMMINGIIYTGNTTINGIGGVPSPKSWGTPGPSVISSMCF